MRTRSTAFLLTILMLSGCLVQAQDADLGTIDFPTSAAPEAQAHFIRGVLFLHSFEYADAAAAFQAAQAAEPEFAMAHWGEAMTHNHPIWDQQNQSAARAILDRLGETPEARAAKAPTQREKAYLHTLEVLYGEGTKPERDHAYAAAMQRLAQTYPDDHEAQTFYALSILGTTQGARDFRTYMQAGAIAQRVFQANPRHPGAAHYVIHSFDDPIHAPLGLDAARAYADIAPDAPHALHMPSHIFLALGKWPASASSNEASAAAAQKKGNPGLHPTWWLTYTYLQQGRYEKARALVEEVAASHATAPSGSKRAHLAFMQSAYMAETRQWDRPLDPALDQVTGLRQTAAGSVLLARGMQAVATDRGDDAEVALLALRNLLPDGDYSDDEETVGLMAMALEALILEHQGKIEKSLVVLNAAAQKQETLQFEFGPAMPVKPIHELHGEVLLRAGRAAEARTAFQRALARDTNRALSLLGLARSQMALGDADAARQTYLQLQANWQEADTQLMEWPEVRTHTSP